MESIVESEPASCYEPTMGNTIDIAIPVEPETAAALADARNREAIGSLISRIFSPDAQPSALARSIAELAAYNAERRDRRAAV